MDVLEFELGGMVKLVDTFALRANSPCESGDSSSSTPIEKEKIRRLKRAIIEIRKLRKFAESILNKRKEESH